jgi:hypothetical protein
MKSKLIFLVCTSFLFAGLQAGHPAGATDVPGDRTPPRINDVQAAVGADSAVITWTTDEPATSNVLYGTTRFHEAKSTGATALVTSHRAVLTGLRPATTYHYQVVSLDRSGNPASSTDRTFVTADAPLPANAGDRNHAGAPAPPWASAARETARTRTPQEATVSTCGGSGNFTVYVPLIASGTPTDMSAPSSAALRASSGAIAPACTPSAIQSDDFNTTSLNTGRWQFVNPAGDATLRLNGTNALISVPAGTYHNVWTDGISAPHLMQAAPNTDFEIEAKFESAPRGTYAMQGILVEADSQNFLRFDFYSVGTGMQIFAASLAGGASIVRSNQPIDGGLPLYMRVKRQGNIWTQFYSYDGAGWAPNISFTETLSVTSVGVFVGNAAEGAPTSAPAYTGSIDYFFDTAAPIVPEDANTALDTTPPTISDVQYNVPATTLAVSWTTDEEATGKVEYGKTAAYELGSVSQSGRTYLHSALISGLEPNTTYNFRISSTDAGNNTSHSGNLLIKTNGSNSSAPAIDLWYGHDQVFAQHGNPQQWINILGRVSDPDGVASLQYSLNGGPPAPLSIGPDTRRLYKPGDFNIELDYQNLVNGVNTVTISATDTLANRSVENVDVHYTAGQTWPQTYSIDWSAASSIQQAAQVVDGLWTIEGGSVRTVEVGYDRLLDIGDVSWTDYEVTVPITIHSFNPAGFQQPSNGQGIGVALRWKGHYDWDGSQPRYGYNPKGAIGWYSWSSTLGYRLSILGNQEVLLAEDTSGRTLAFDVRYIFKMRVETRPGQTSMYRLKVWQDGTPEPAAWDLSAPNYPGELSAGSLLLVAHQTDASFGNVIVVPITPAAASGDQ